MSTQHALAGQEPFVLAAQEGQHLHFLNHLASIKVPASRSGSMSVVEFLAPRGFGPPTHRHEEEDELFLVLEGELVFHAGELEIPGGPGTYAHLPRAVPHTFQVVSDTARFVNVTSSPTTTPQFDLMVSALGVPVAEPTMPEPGYVDPARVAEVCHRYGIEIVGPPPPALA